MIAQSHALERMLRRKRQEEETAEFHSCVLLTPELKQMKKDDKFSLLSEIQAE